MADFENIKKEIAQASLQSVDESIPFVVECDASEVAISATLNQGGRPIAFISRSFQGSELHYPAVEKEATAIIEAVRKWNHFLSRQHFTLVTDQRSVSFMLDNRKRTKIKNNKIQHLRLELSSTATLFCTCQERTTLRPILSLGLTATQYHLLNLKSMMLFVILVSLGFCILYEQKTCLSRRKTFVKFVLIVESVQS